MIVGLDISTSCTGICVLNDDGTLNAFTYVDLKKIKSFYHKVDAVLSFLVHDLKLPHDVHFYIESPLMMFKMKESMIQTLTLLQKFNACICYGIYRSFGVEPALVSAATARKQAGIMIPKTAKKQAKALVFDFVKQTKLIPENVWEYKRTGPVKDWCLDSCDAFVVAYSSFLRYHKAKCPQK